MTLKTLGAILLLVFISLLIYRHGRPLWVPLVQAAVGKRTTDEVLKSYGPAAEARLREYFNAAQQPYPPQRITLLVIKDEMRLELWAEADTGQNASAPVFIHAYPIQAASGELGPKLREGDRQVPEGIYQLEYLNPNSAYHLSMKLNYPNAFDRQHALAEGRDQPGSDIFIHGKAVSIGCLAMGDLAIEELFVLTSVIGKEQVNVAIAPRDPRRHDLSPLAMGQPAWVGQLYDQLNHFYADFAVAQ